MQISAASPKFVLCLNGLPMGWNAGAPNLSSHEIFGWPSWGAFSHTLNGAQLRCIHGNDPPFDLNCPLITVVQSTGAIVLKGILMKPVQMR